MRATTSLIKQPGLPRSRHAGVALDRKAAIRRADFGIVGGAAWLSKNG
jgi:hypothetical protein